MPDACIVRRDGARTPHLLVFLLCFCASGFLFGLVYLPFLSYMVRPIHWKNEKKPESNVLRVPEKDETLFSFLFRHGVKSAWKEKEKMNEPRSLENGGS